MYLTSLSEKDIHEVTDPIIKAWHKRKHIYLDEDQVQMLGLALQEMEARINELEEQLQDLENKYDVFAGD